MTPSALLVSWRHEQGWSQREAADILGVSQSAWAQWETGCKEPDNAHAQALEFLTARRVLAVQWPSVGRLLFGLKKRLRERRRRRVKAAHHHGVAP